MQESGIQSISEVPDYTKSSPTPVTDNQCFGSVEFRRRSVPNHIVSRAGELGQQSSVFRRLPSKNTTNRTRRKSPQPPTCRLQEVGKGETTSEVACRSSPRPRVPLRQVFQPKERSTRVPTGSSTNVSAKRPSRGRLAVPPLPPAARAVFAASFTSFTSMPK